MGIIIFHLPASKYVLKLVTCRQLRDKEVKTEYSCTQDYIVAQHATRCSTPISLLLSMQVSTLHN